MLQELKNYENLGTPKYFFELLEILRKSNIGWPEKEICSLFINRNIDGKSIFDGCINLGIEIGILITDFNENILIAPFLNNFLNSEIQLTDKIVELLLLTLKDDNDFQEIFSAENISYDIIYHSIQINNAAFKFKYSCFKQLLLDFDIIRVHPTREIKKYIFNSRYKKLFDKSVLPEIKKRKIGIEELKKNIEQKQIYGEEAELFVLSFEKNRLNNKEGIDWVAEYSVAEGYDILSFNSISSINNDRCIEVKSFSKKPYFFWSRNEIDIARIKGEQYFLYLVDRDEFKFEGYCPLIIQNPYENVLNHNKWNKIVEKYRVDLNY